MVALPVALIFILAGEFIIPWVFGAEFSAAHAPLAILAMGQLVNAGFGSVGFLLNMTGYERISSRILWQTALLNILLNAIMIPLFGIVGASVATAISLVIWNALLYREVRKHLRISSTAFQFTRK
jgi:O-antigen/teichoic acid export membrane protein